MFANGKYEQENFYLAMNQSHSKALQLIAKDLDLEIQADTSSWNMDKLHQWLTYEVAILIDQDFQMFLNMLYRIDVDEQKVKAAFAENDAPASIAGLIIDRELMKVKTREKYSDME